MKTMRKKILFVLVIAIISAISLTALPATAIPWLDVEFTIDEYEGMTEERAAQIMRSILGLPNETIQPHSILCWFRHNIQTGTITATQHNVHAANPRCVRTITAVEFCTRDSCSHFIVTSEVSSRISCC